MIYRCNQSRQSISSNYFLSTCSVSPITQLAGQEGSISRPRRCTRPNTNLLHFSQQLIVCCSTVCSFDLYVATIFHQKVSASFCFTDTCKNISNPKYADYYYPHIMEGIVCCISRCFKGTQDSMNCYSGICRLSEIGPHCM